LTQGEQAVITGKNTKESVMQKQTIVTGAAALVTAGALALGGSALANAGSSTNASPASYSTANPSATAGPGQGRGLGRANAPGQQIAPGQIRDKLKALALEHGIAGDTAVKVTQAATAKEPTAYVLRVWKATDGTYRAHMLRPDGTRIILTIDGNFSVTKVEDAPAAGQGRAGRGPAATSTPPATGS